MSRREESLSRKSRQRAGSAAISTALLVLSFCQTLSAQNALLDKPSKAYKLRPNLYEYLREKYKDRISEVAVNIQETPQGPKGSLYITGHVRAGTSAAPSADKPARLRATARAFLFEESDMLGLPDPNEVREEKISTTASSAGESTDIYYSRLIKGLPFQSAPIRVTLGPDETITAVQAVFVPVPPELYQAAAKEMIAEKEVYRIIERDLKTHGFSRGSFRIIQVARHALAAPPYVIWTASVSSNKDLEKGSSNYVLNALTGEVLQRADPLLTD